MAPFDVPEKYKTNIRKCASCVLFRLWASFFLIKSAAHTTTLVHVRSGALIYVVVVMGRLGIYTYAEQHNDGGWNRPSASGGGDSNVVDIYEIG